MKPRVSLPRIVVALLLAAWPRLALASADYPGEVQAEWQLPGNAPPCTVCHQTDLGGAGTATKPFARSLQREGLLSKDVGSLDLALSILKQQNTDSDGDGASDIDELRAQTDPNDGPGVFTDYPLPQTGCSFRGASPARQHRAVLWCLALCGVTCLVRLRRARRG